MKTASCARRIVLASTIIVAVAFLACPVHAQDNANRLFFATGDRFLGEDVLAIESMDYSGSDRRSRLRTGGYLRSPSVACTGDLVAIWQRDFPQPLSVGDPGAEVVAGDVGSPDLRLITDARAQGMPPLGSAFIKVELTYAVDRLRLVAWPPWRGIDSFVRIINASTGLAAHDITPPGGIIDADTDPNGPAVAFVKASDPYGKVSEAADIFLGDDQTGPMRRLTHLRDVAQVSWSPGGTHLVFSRNKVGGNPWLDWAENRDSDIWVVNATSGVTWPLVSGSTFDHSPVWSSDGRQVFFVRVGASLFAPDGRLRVWGNADVWSIDVITRQLRNVTTTPDRVELYPETTCLGTTAPPVKEPPVGSGMCVCTRVQTRVPAVAVSSALASPENIYGWEVPLDPNKPVNPTNPLRECLDLRNPNLSYHPIANGLEWRVGCR